MSNGGTNRDADTQRYAIDHEKNRFEVFPHRHHLKKQPSSRFLRLVTLIKIRALAPADTTHVSNWRFVSNNLGFL